MLRRMSIAMLALVLPGLAATDASAHPKLTLAIPAANAVIATSPKELRMSFNEGLVAKFSGVEVKTDKGQKIETGQAAADPADKKQLVIPLPTALADGTYNVAWHVVSEDTHRVKGSYSFTVKH